MSIGVTGIASQMLSCTYIALVMYVRSTEDGVARQSRQVKRLNPKVRVTNHFGGSSLGRTVYVCDNRNVRRFLVDIGMQISVISPTATGRRQLNPRLFFQATNTSPIVISGTFSLSRDIGLHGLSHLVFVVAEVPCVILDSDFFAAFYCRHFYLNDQSTSLTVQGIPSSVASGKLAVFDPDSDNQFRQLLTKHSDSPVLISAFLPHRTMLFIISEPLALLRFLGPAISRLHVWLLPRSISSTCPKWTSVIKPKTYGPHPST
nr:unnamed protein product [Spirometra erinaceieuropaei]